MKKYLTLTCFLAVVLSSVPFANALLVPAGTPTQTINVHGRYSLDLPTYLTKSGELNFEASLEYQNITKEVYIIVIDEPTEDFVNIFKELQDYDSLKSPLDNYVDAQLESIRGNMSKVTSESAPRKVKTQSGEAVVYDINGFQDGIDGEMGFSVAFMQGKNCLYMLMTWTFASSKSTYQADMDNMITSFKELSGAIDTYPHYFATAKYSIELPNGLTSDTGVCALDCIGLSRAEGNLCVGISEFEKAEWKEAYKTWPDRKTYSLLEYFAMDQKNFQAQNAPRSTTHTEMKKSKTNGAPSCFFTRTEPETDEYPSWHYESLIIEGKDHFFYINVYCPVNDLERNRAEIQALYASFKLK